jgi:chemotaxis protein MotB
LSGLIELTKMSIARDPFSESVTKANRGPIRSKAAWIAASSLAVLLILALLRLAFAPERPSRPDLRISNLSDAKAGLTNVFGASQRDEGRIAALQKQVADLENEKKLAGERAKGLENEMHSRLESKDVTVSNTQGKLTVNIPDLVMFDSGEASLKPDGETVLRKFAAILASHPELEIHVGGYTDNMPIRTQFASNWELSAARALAAVHFLTERAGVDPRRVAAVGYGEYRPIADNSTSEGRARNRRIAITILPD